MYKRQDLDGLEGRIARLKSQGFQIAVDDLGAGYAGLSSLMNLQPHIAKIDMSLVRGIDQDPRKQSIIKSLVWLCKELGIPLVEHEGGPDHLIRDVEAALA